MRIIRYLNEKSVPVLAALTKKGLIYSLPQKDFLELAQQAQEQNTSLLLFVESAIDALDPHPRPALPIDVLHQLVLSFLLKWPYLRDRQACR